MPSVSAFDVYFFLLPRATDYLNLKFLDITTNFVRGLDLLLASEVDTRV
jgi:hypothetical protein